MIIVGEGKRHDELEGYIKYNGLKKRVLMTGFSDNPYKYIKSADLCVFPVKNDSYGTAAVESVILGKPVIISDCKGVMSIGCTTRKKQKKERSIFQKTLV